MGEYIDLQISNFQPFTNAQLQLYCTHTVEVEPEKMSPDRNVHVTSNPVTCYTVEHRKPPINQPKKRKIYLKTH